MQESRELAGNLVWEINSGYFTRGEKLFNNLGKLRTIFSNDLNIGLIGSVSCCAGKTNLLVLPSQGDIHAEHGVGDEDSLLL